MNKSRLEAFSDGVLSIIITIMVLEFKPPQGGSFADLVSMWPLFLSYILSFIYVGIYWNNHHHLFQLVKSVRGPILWANLHLLFWLSLIPFVTSWANELRFASVQVAMYGAVLFMCSVAYNLLVRMLVAEHDLKSDLTKAVGSGVKGKISAGLYLVGIGLTFWSAFVGLAVFVIVAVMWMVPDLRVEKRFD